MFSIKALYNAQCPDVPGGGNVKWTNPWGEYAYFEDIETKEDGGTPGILQVIRAAMAIRLKEEMGTQNIAQREKQLIALCFERLKGIQNLKILGDEHSERIGCVSFTVSHIHYNLLVRLLNDRFGIQVRGGWSCASTYSHYLLDIDQSASSKIIEGITNKNLTEKPGWVRLSLHPTMATKELVFICDAIDQIVQNIEEWKKDYTYNPATNEFDHHYTNDNQIKEEIKGWFLGF